MHLYAPVVI